MADIKEDPINTFTKRIYPLFLANGTSVFSSTGIYNVFCVFSLITRGKAASSVLNALGLANKSQAAEYIIKSHSKNNSTILYTKEESQFKPEIGKLLKNILEDSLSIYNKESDIDIIVDEVKKVFNGFLNPDGLKKMLREDIASFAIINSLYFHENWELPFKPGDTYPDKFLDSSVEMMTSDDKDYLYFENDEVQMLKLKYKNANHSSFIITLPKKKKETDLRKYVKYLTNVKFETATISLLQMPKFDFNSNLDISEIIKHLGIIIDDNWTDAFNNPSSGDIHLQQQVRISVDEKGTTAAAETELCDEECEYEDKIFFIANHPFLYSIIQNGQPIISGAFYG